MLSEKNILIVSKSSQPGGLEFHVLDLIKVFAPANKVYVMVPPGPLTEDYRNAGAQVIIEHPSSALDFFFINRVKNFCRSNSIHVLHAHELINATAVFSAFLAKVPKRVYHVHTPFLFWRYKNFFEKILRIPFNWFANFVIANVFSTDVICLTPQIKRHRIFFEFILPYKLRVVPNAVDVGRISKRPTIQEINNFKKLHRIPLDKVVIGNISRLTQEKDHMTLLKAFNKLNTEFPQKYFLLIAGGGDYETEYWDYADQNFPKLCLITGRFEEKDKLNFMCSIDYAVFPSLAEGFGYVLAEFMAAKIPIIASDLPVLKHVGGLGVWYFRRGDIGALYNQLKFVLSLSDNLANEKITKAYQKVQEYSLDSFAKNYSTIYASR